MSIWSKPQIPAQSAKLPSAAKADKGSGATGFASDMEALQQSLAQAEASKTQYGYSCRGESSETDTDIESSAMVIDAIPGQKKGAKKSKLLSGVRASSAPRSMPTSPAISVAGGSPHLGPALSASQQAIERAKEQRITLIHELAAQDRPVDYLKDKWSGKMEEFMPTLKKVADFNETTQKWTMGKPYWKELDVWNYDYDTQEVRQKAIDNAVRQYDKMRLSTSQPQWERLLHKEERGKGKCLSRLQANLNKGPAPAPAPAAPTPKIKVQKAEDSNNDSGKDDSTTTEGKSTPMVRSASNPLPPKKKISEREAQQKRLLARRAAAASKATTSPTKGKAGAVSKTGGRILSEQFVIDSDSDSEDQALAAKSKVVEQARDKERTAAAIVAAAPPPAPVPIPPPKQKAATKPTKVRPPSRPAVAAPPIKRRREEEGDADEEEDMDGSSSSSGKPLSKRIKQRPTNVAAPSVSLKQRPAELGQGSRGGNSSSKSKNTSPAKSSPLASSPPTNASDLDQAEAEVIAAARPAAQPRKRVGGRDEGEREKPKVKRQRPDVPTDVFNKAHKFKMYYEKYQELHWEIADLEDPPREKVDNLLDMRQRLQSMKSEIYRECPPGRA